jgi:hypothetical protein
MCHKADMKNTPREKSLEEAEQMKAQAPSDTCGHPQVSPPIST